MYRCLPDEIFLFPALQALPPPLTPYSIILLFSIFHIYCVIGADRAMSKVISLRDETYKTLAGATGKLMNLTKLPNSMSSTADYSINVIDTLLEAVERESQRNPSYRQHLTKAIESQDRELIVEALLSAVRN